MSLKSDNSKSPFSSRGQSSSSGGSPSRNIKRMNSNLIEVKSKFDAEFRRFSIPCVSRQFPKITDFRLTIGHLHGLRDIPFTLCYTDTHGDLLPITNDENFRKALDSARPVLRLLIQRKGESWQEKYGYGTNSIDRKRKGLTGVGLGFLASGGVKTQRRSYQISMPEDFRQVSAIIDVDVVPETHRRVKLCKHGSDRPLGFYIRDGTSVRVTTAGVVKVAGIFISRLVPGGLAESTGLLAVNDEVLEVNGIEVSGKTLDQVTDMMVANASNLIITVKPANQRLTLQRGDMSRASGNSDWSEGARSSLYASDDDDTDEVKDLLQQNTLN